MLAPIGFATFMTQSERVLRIVADSRTEVSEKFIY